MTRREAHDHTAAIDDGVPDHGAAFDRLAEDEDAYALVDHVLGVDPLALVLEEYARTYWPGALAGVVQGADSFAVTWAQYLARHPEPVAGSPTIPWERELAHWRVQGPQPSPPVRRFLALEAADREVIRALADLV